MGSKDVELMGHLMRRAGFGAGLAELEARAARGYDATVDELVATDSQDGIDDDLLYRYHPDQQGGLGLSGAAAYWLYRMVNTEGALHEKMTLFWHSVFATGYPKVTQGKILMNQLAMFRQYGMGSFRDLLVELSRDPAMIMWLDNEDNHAGAINENYGRELLELFSMGVGNYTEEDVKEAARAFTGWTVANTEYMTMRAERDSLWPYGRLAYRFEYRPEDHDNGEKEFLGHRGRFGGEDVVDVICRQPATARFIARHLYHFFVADEPPVPQWPYESPRDPAAIELLTEMSETRGVRNFIYTDTARDGTLSHPNFGAIDEILSEIEYPIMVAGGIATVEDVLKLRELGAAGAITGMAIYTGSLDLAEAIEAVEEKHGVEN